MGRKPLREKAPIKAEKQRGLEKLLVQKKEQLKAKVKLWHQNEWSNLT